MKKDIEAELIIKNIKEIKEREDGYEVILSLVKELADKNNKGFIAELCREKLREMGEL